MSIIPLALSFLITVPVFASDSDPEDWSKFVNVNHYAASIRNEENRILSFEEIEDIAEKIRAANPERSRIADVFGGLGYILPPKSVLDELAEMEKAAKAPLENHKIIKIAQFLLEAEGKTLEKRRRCFTCQMRVLTPSGYRYIGSLKEGDLVLSWDFDKKELVENRIEKIHDAASAFYGTLEVKDPLVAKIEVTPEHPFFSANEGVFRSLKDINPGENLAGLPLATSINRLKGRCSALFNLKSLTVAVHGGFKPIGYAKVRSLTLSGKFKNYFVEGILVHNKPVHVTFLNSQSWRNYV